MKSKLLATSALVAAGLWGTTEAAFAQAKVAPITVVVGGYFEQTFGYASNEDGVVGGNLAAGSKPQNIQQHSDSEIWFGGRTTLANGITIGFDVQLEANTQSDQIDESYLFVDGAFGRIVAGSENDAAYIMHYGAPGAGKAYGPLESGAVDWVQRPANVAFIDTTAQRLVSASPVSDRTSGGLTGVGDDQQRLTYYTPRFFGFQGGISYTPSNGEDSTAFAPVNKNTVRTNAWAGAVNYVNTFSGFSVAVSAGIAYWPKVDNQVSTSALADAITDYAFGFNLGYMGFVVGGAYRKYDAGDNNVNDGYAYNIGATYTTGPFAVGLSWHHSKAEGLTSNSGSDEVDQILLSAAYTMGPGVDLIGSIFYLDYSDETSNQADNNNGVGVVGGVRLSF
jgi:outer membrane protein OmpU